MRTCTGHANGFLPYLFMGSGFMLATPLWLESDALHGRGGWSVQEGEVAMEHKSYRSGTGLFLTALC